MINEKAGKVNGKFSRRRNYSGIVSHFFYSLPTFCSCLTYLYGMELNQKINIRITAEQLKQLMISVIKEKTTLSELVRKILHQYNEENKNQSK